MMHAARQSDRHHRRAIATAAALLLTGRLLAQPPGPAPEAPSADPRGSLTLHRAVELALATAPALAAARAQQEAATAALREAEAARRPTAHLGAAASQYQEPALVAPIHGFTPDLLPQFDRTLVQGELRVSYELYSGGARAARIDQHAAQAGAATSRVASEQQLAMARAAFAFLDILTLREALEAHDQRIAALAAEQRRVETMLDAGRAAVVDLRRIEAGVAGAEAERIRLAAQLDNAERELARLTGLPEDATRAAALRTPAFTTEPAASAPAIGPSERAELAASAQVAQPAVAQAEAELRVAEAMVLLAEGARRPRATASGAWIDYGSAEGDFTAEWNAGVRLAFPIWEGGARLARIAAARATRDAAAERLRAVREQASREIDRAAASFEQALASARSLARAVSSFAEVARIEQLRLDAGTGTQTDFLDAQADLLASRADLARARHGALGARIELARAAGQLSPEWLVRNLEPAP
jgi:outer membrane protein